MALPSTTAGGGGTVTGAGGGTSAATGFGVASAGLDLIAGLFGLLGGEELAGIGESRARMLQLEADTDAQRFTEQARSFKARQKLVFLKSGVELTGSPLAILDETMRIAGEQASAIRARGRAQAFGAELEAVGARQRGRSAFIGGVRGASRTLLTTEFLRRRNA